MRLTSSPGRFSLALVGERHLQSQGKAPWGRGCDEQGKGAQVVHVGARLCGRCWKGEGREGGEKTGEPLSLSPQSPLPFPSFHVVTAITPVWCHLGSSQSIKIGTDLSIDESIKIGKSDLIDIDCMDQLVEIDDTLVSFIDLSWFLPISSIYIGRYICLSVHSKMKTDFMQTVNLLTIELQLRVEGSNDHHFLNKYF